MSTTEPHADARVINYDADGYDYRRFWNGRDYEQWAEARVIRRALRRTTPFDWFVDFGGGFGRNVPLYRERAAHVVLVDYSWTNLRNAEDALLADGPNDRVFLVRANLYHLPFRDAAFDGGATVRVLHHLSALDAALAEMGRTLGRAWLLDVPIKHHLLARARALATGRAREMATPAPNDIGTPAEPFFNFHLATVRRALAAAGWTSHLAASVANFRRWERLAPGPMQAVARPVVYGAEAVAQGVGRGWWGPAQFLWLERPTVIATSDMRTFNDEPAPGAVPEGSIPGVQLWLSQPWNALAPRMRCPRCAGPLQWADDEATCPRCPRRFARKGAIWDFVEE